MQSSLPSNLPQAHTGSAQLAGAVEFGWIGVVPGSVPPSLGLTDSSRGLQHTKLVSGLRVVDAALTFSMICTDLLDRFTAQGRPPLLLLSSFLPFVQLPLLVRGETHPNLESSADCTIEPLRTDRVTADGARPSVLLFGEQLGDVLLMVVNLNPIRRRIGPHTVLGERAACRLIRARRPIRRADETHTFAERGEVALLAAPGASTSRHVVKTSQFDSPSRRARMGLSLYPRVPCPSLWRGRS